MREKFQQKQSYENLEIKCYLCKSKGHIAIDCHQYWKIKGNLNINNTDKKMSSLNESEMNEQLMKTPQIVRDKFSTKLKDAKLLIKDEDI